ncbi:hypothetical protein ETB97_008990 [Aspergillus alliaceus]|uniref:Uncharacterized protein n=1 Tax=Petromyces alliaceus TaxID=209559 RepID=A0A8H5ZUI9_PETAA|nr:hypothetical protein ETB97_008990 [Aspergillus burnettii]
MRTAGALVYRSLLYLPQYPYRQPIHDFLAYMGLLRALAWALPAEARLVYEISKWRRPDPRQTPEDSFSRALQLPERASLSRLMRNMQGSKRSRELLILPALATCSVILNLPKRTTMMSDEMSHDVLDVLFSIQLQIIWLMQPPRDGFRATARKLVGDERLHE